MQPQINLESFVITPLLIKTSCSAGSQETVIELAVAGSCLFTPPEAKWLAEVSGERKSANYKRRNAPERTARRRNYRRNNMMHGAPCSVNCFLPMPRN